MKTAQILAIMVSVLVLCCAGVSEAASMGTVFTYQGRLIDSNDAADGLYDFEFELYNYPLVGIQIGSTVDANDVDVIDGYFTVELDFGSGVFEGDARWLEVGVRPGDSNGVYTTLEPRHELTPAPYSLYAALAGTVNTPFELSGSSADAIIKGSNDGSGGSGVYGLASGSGGYGVYGQASNTANEENVGGYFMASGKKAKAVYGNAGSTEDENYGGYFMAAGKKAKAVYGTASAADDAENYGGYFQAVGKKKSTAVFGEAASTDGDENYGGYFVAVGKKKSTAVFGNASSTDDVENYGGYFIAAFNNAKAVYGKASSSDDNENYGGYFMAAGKKAKAVYGIASSAESGINYGGWFEAAGTYGRGVYGKATGGSGAALYGEGMNGSKAGYFEGEVEITGDVAIGTSDASSTLNISNVLRLQPLSTAPANPSEGDMYMNSRTHKLMVFDGTTWQSCW